jgi:hypothetical protein
VFGPADGVRFPPARTGEAGALNSASAVVDATPVVNENPTRPSSAPEVAPGPLVAKLACAALVVGANFTLPTLSDTAQGWVFAGDGILAGLLIVRWWAVGIASSMLLVSLTVSPGREDTQGFIVFVVGILGSLSQAALIVVGVFAAKGAAMLGRRRRPAAVSQGLTADQ